MFSNMFPKDMSGLFSMPDQSSMDDMMKPSREAFEYWISFFPTAPLFGVEYRFGNMEEMSKSMMMPMPGFEMPGFPMQGFPMPGFPMSTPTAAKAAKPNGAAAAPKTATPPAKATPPKAPETAEAVPKEAAPKKVAEKAEAAPVAVVKAPTKPKAAPKKAAAKPKAKAAPAPAADGKPAALMTAKPSKVDDLKLIKGIGPGLEKELNRLGVYQFDQMAGFKKADLTWIDENLSAFKGRCFRDDWVGQAKGLMG